jgi:hypothetical protein
MLPPVCVYIYATCWDVGWRPCKVALKGFHLRARGFAGPSALMAVTLWLTALVTRAPGQLLAELLQRLRP